ncbi:MAG TPA: hypothetical protein VN493_24240 [Thermoanaerobaculia bacterium]|nr:hypothetical protein [Thermoanaerobaculia bacterium]
MEAEALVVDLTLGLFSDLASLEARNPSAVPRLLRTDPREPGSDLKSLGIDFESFRQGISSAGVRPFVLFLSPGADPVEEARRRGIAIAPWPEQAPPALLVGRELDTFVFFEPLTPGQGRSERISARAQLASLAQLRSFALALNPSAERLDSRRYWVDPQRWSKSVLFEHTRCEERAMGLELVTKLTYAGGATDTLRTKDDLTWRPCTLVRDSNLEAVKVKQTSRDKAGRNVVVASSYFRYPVAGPVLSRSVPVK